MMIDICVITWWTKKQKCIATSNMEAEFTAASLAIKDFVWIRGLLEECKICYSEESFIYIDNQAAIEQLQEQTCGH
jgi:hypothetical protein